MSTQSTLPYPVLPDEAQRLSELHAYQLLDTPPEEDLDRLARLAAQVFQTPISLVSLVDGDRQFFKANVGLDVPETPRSVSFCAHAIADDEVFVVADANTDPRFANFPLVTDSPGIRFYAGAPLVSPSGYRLGAFCIMDTRVRDTFSANDRLVLRDFAALVQDRLELRRLEAALGMGRAHFERAAASSPDAVVCLNAQGEIAYWNDAAARIFGYDPSEILGRGFDVLVPDHVRVWMELAHGAPGDAYRPWGKSVAFTGVRKGGEAFYFEMSMSMWRERDMTTFGLVVRDLGVRRHREERLFRLARFDPLTELSDRESLHARLDADIQKGAPFSLLLIDVHGLQQVNDTYGYRSGDDVLKTYARRLRALFKPPAHVTRLGGAQFAVALASEFEVGAVSTACRQALHALADPVAVDSGVVELGGHVGVAIYPTHGSSAERLLANADLALFEARKFDAGTYRFFVSGLRDAVLRRVKFEAELQAAHEQGQLELYYQPVFDLRSGAVAGAEALLRWNHPMRGLLSPGQFINALEESPVAGRVGTWILATACAQAAAWRREGLPGFRVAVNLFGLQLHSEDLLAEVDAILTKTGLPPDGLELEITENTLLHSEEQLGQALRDLREAGVGIAFDDYGTGYASLSLLKRLPISRLKIDRSFIANVSQDNEDAAVVRAILYLARQFKLGVVAEGVESAAQEAFLRVHGCHEVQGFHYGRPLSIHDFRRKYVVASG